MSTYHIIVLVQSISILILAVGAIYLVSNWRGKEHSYLVLFCIATMVNNIGAFVEITAHESKEILIGTKFAYVGKVFIPLTFFLFVMQYCEITIPKKVQLILAIFHFSIALMVFTYPMQKWFYTSVTHTEEGLFPHNVYGHGIMYNVYTACLVLYFLVVFTVIIAILKKEKRKKRRIQMCYMLACTVCAIMGFVLFLTGVTRGYDTTSLSYAICTIFMAIALAKYDLLDTLELVRNYVIDNLSLDIIALDEDDRIIYYNEPVQEVYPDFEKNQCEIVEDLITRCKQEKMVEVGEKVYKPEYKELVKNGQYRGHIITLSDITDNYNYTMLMKKMTEIDSLTGLYNRFAYEYRISELKKKETLPENLIFFAMDVNGLKNVNDTKGHDAGDALIYDAAQCILKGINGCGECYRVGGDEFTAIIMDDRVDAITIKRKIQDYAKACDNETYSVSISIGYCIGKEHTDMRLEDLEKIADKKMYQEKENYYITKGVNRRVRDEVYDAIYESYLKILKVNLVSGDFDIIKMDINEKEENYGFSRNIQTWLYHFAHCGMVYEEDVDEYLEKSNLDFLREQFKNGNKKRVKLYYRRRFGDDYRNVMLEIIPQKENRMEEQIVFFYVKEV